MARSGLGWCPFAEQVEGVNTFVPEHLANVGFCDHTAGGYYSTLKSAAFWNGAGVSTHFGIARDGRICQMVNIFHTAFAQGRLGPVVIWPYYDEMQQQNPNLYLISTEHEDCETVGGKTVYVPGSQWTEAQYQADLKLKRWCVEECRKKGDGNDPLKYGTWSLTGHYMFDSINRAECPGRYWRDEYRARLFNDLVGENPMPAERVWLYGNEQAGCEVRGKQLFYWHNGIEVDAVGDYEGKLPGAHYHHAGQNPDGSDNWVEVLR